MHWFRARLRSSSLVALFALALQLALSFGHVHLGDLSGQAPAQIETSGTTAPAGGDTPDHADGYCALCAIIHLAGALVPAAIPFLPVPVAYRRAQSLATVRVDAPTQRISVFAARAPPVA
ncbi:MAG TPA: DUF2946 family protein [Xanthobacteraceae bacterium]